MDSCDVYPVDVSHRLNLRLVTFLSRSTRLHVNSGTECCHRSALHISNRVQKIVTAS